MFCVKCGNQIPNGALFCSNCGSKSEEIPTQSTVVQQQTPPVSQANTAYQYTQPQANTNYYPQPQTNTNYQQQMVQKKKKGCLKPILIILALVAAFFIYVAMNGGEVSFSTAKIADIKTSSDVDQNTKKAVNITSTFSTSSPVVYVSVQVKNAPEGTNILAKWIYLTGNIDIIESEFELTDVNQQIAFSLSKPNNGFPVGKYEVKLFMNGEYSKSAFFDVK